MRISHTTVIARVATTQQPRSIAYAIIPVHESINEAPTFGVVTTEFWYKLVGAWLDPACDESDGLYGRYLSLICGDEMLSHPWPDNVWSIDASTLSRASVREALRMRPQETWAGWVERKYGIPHVHPDQAHACALAVWARKRVHSTEHASVPKPRRR